MPEEAVFRPQPKARKQQQKADSSSEEEEEEDTSSEEEEEEEEEEGGPGRETVVGVLKAGLAIKNPPKKTT
jgi:hypothetical protein